MSKTFSQYAVDKIKDVFLNHSDHVGSELKKQFPSKYKDKVSSDCITFAIWVLKDAFTKVGNIKAAGRAGNLGYKGTELAKYLIAELGWHGVYYNPDVNHPSDGSGEHIASYYNQVKKTCKYSVANVPVSHKVINYNPSGIIVTSYLGATKKSEVDLTAFKKIPFGVGVSRGGDHVWVYSYGKVYESHWDKEAGAGLYTAVPMEDFIWLSGIVVIPKDSNHLLNMSPVLCKAS